MTLSHVTFPESRNYSRWTNPTNQLNLLNIPQKSDQVVLSSIATGGSEMNRPSIPIVTASQMLPSLKPRGISPLNKMPFEEVRKHRQQLYGFQ